MSQITTVTSYYNTCVLGRISCYPGGSGGSGPLLEVSDEIFNFVVINTACYVFFELWTTIRGCIKYQFFVRNIDSRQSQTVLTVVGHFTPRQFTLQKSSPRIFMLPLLYISLYLDELKCLYRFRFKAEEILSEHVSVTKRDKCSAKLHGVFCQHNIEKIKCWVTDWKVNSVSVITYTELFSFSILFLFYIHANKEKI